MTGSDVIEAARDALLTTFLIAAPLMILGTVVGVAVTLFQALTQIQEMSLIYAPKIIATFVFFLLVLPFMAETLRNFMFRMASLIAITG